LIAILTSNIFIFFRETSNIIVTNEMHNQILFKILVFVYLNTKKSLFVQTFSLNRNNI